MKKYTKKELDKILENHLHWIHQDCDGWKQMRADLCKADLFEADLSGAILIGADLSKADLREANLHETSLYKADLIGADLREANLSRVNLYRADLSGAYLCGADLYGADLHEALLYRADLTGAKNVPFIPMACPDTGEFTAWKKCDGGIVKLLIPNDAKRLSAGGRKCRADKAVVLDIQDFEGNSMEYKEIQSHYDKTFIYRVGETVTPKQPFCENRWKECSSGIHFYINREEAVMMG